METKLKHIADLTNGNNHGGARWYVADLYPYLALYKRRFELIDKLHEIEGSMDYNLMLYRNKITKEIYNKEGSKVVLGENGADQIDDLQEQINEQMEK